MPIIVILCAISVCLQLYIFFKIKKHNEDILENIFEGVFFKKKKGYMKKVMLFYYNPMSWKGIKELEIKVALSINLLIFIFVLSTFIFGKYW